jgi:glycosyltransferase involved in cell wall biosynthesis
MHPKKTVIVYRDELLGSSETFIRAQAESLQGFAAFYLGLRRIPGLDIPESRSHILTTNSLLGRVQRDRFKLFGPSASQRRTIASQNPSLIHAHFGPDACHAITFARSLHVPLVTTFHGYDITMSDRHMPYLYLRRRELLKKVGSKFLCVSKFVRERAIARGFPSDKTVVHYTGIDTEFFRPDVAVERSPIVLFVGRLVPKKGCCYLIQAMASVQATIPEARLVVVGNGPLRSELESQAKSILNNVEFVGMRDPASVRQWMNRAMIFCNPSLIAPTGDAEGFGMVFAEAQAMGLPVVSFDSGGIPEAVAQGKSGFLVPEKDWKGLADSVSLLLRNPQLWQRFSEAGRARVSRLFDLRKQASLLESIYESVLHENDRPAQSCLRLDPTGSIPA